MIEIDGEFLDDKRNLSIPLYKLKKKRTPLNDGVIIISSDGYMLKGNGVDYIRDLTPIPCFKQNGELSIINSETGELSII